MTTLIVVDVQNDFCERGSLAVTGGLRVAEKIRNELLNAREHEYDHIVFSRDTHEAWPNTNGGHFSETPDYVNTWPVHCVAGSHGYRLNPSVNAWVRDHVASAKLHIYEKGQGLPAYSAFEGHGLFSTDYSKTLAELLFDETQIDVVGLAYDHCVRATALDAKHWTNANVTVLAEYTASVSRSGEIRATAQLVKAGVQIDI